jgi:hypothetical protein
MSQLREWVQANSTLVYFLIAQAFAIATAGVAVVTYVVKMENRVSTMENRGAAYTVQRLDEMDRRLTILETQSRTNTATLNRIVEIMTRELGKNPAGK